ncbi:hypothetical protein EAO70_34040 [Streptomyces sp. adm13(2018)]|nr:hypothetical protein EAO70_34040 [Streptomyces sp. adm13(2018)]
MGIGRISVTLCAFRPRGREAMPPGQTRTEAEAWIDWPTARVERLNPLNTPPPLPDIPAPRVDDLRPLLGDWSPYGL